MPTKSANAIISELMGKALDSDMVVRSWKRPPDEAAVDSMLHWRTGQKGSSLTLHLHFKNKRRASLRMRAFLEWCPLRFGAANSLELISQPAGPFRGET